MDYNIILRTVQEEGFQTKGRTLTNEELDLNFLEIIRHLKEGVPVITTDSEGELSGLDVHWIADTSSEAPSRTIDPDGIKLTVKDGSGNAQTNNITVVAPDGQTINGGATGIINVDNGWVTYARVGTDWKTIGGQ